MSSIAENIAFTILGAVTTAAAILDGAGTEIIVLGGLITLAGIYCLIANRKKNN